MVMREADAGIVSGATTASLEEACRQRNTAPDKYEALLSFKMEVTKIFHAKMYEFTEEESPYN